MLVAFFGSLLSILSAEVFLRWLLERRFISVKLEPRFSFARMSISDHPYLPFVLKKNSTSPRRPAEYPLHKGKFFLPSVSIDESGYLVDHNSLVNNITESDSLSPDQSIKICCLGASTTGNVIGDMQTGEITSYPSELQKYLQAYSKYKIEVVNCGVGLSNSADLLVRYALQIKDLSPDFLIIYHAYNDVYPYLCKDFLSDYSHCRRNLGRSYWKFFLASLVPPIPLLSLQILLNKLIPIRGVINNLNKAVSCGDFDLDQDFTSGLSTYERNIQSIISICKDSSTKVVLSSFCHYLYDDIASSKLHQKYSQIVADENKIMKKLALKNSLLFIDNEHDIEYKESLFVDSIHFTCAGMRFLSSNIGKHLRESFPDHFC